MCNFRLRLFRRLLPLCLTFFLFSSPSLVLGVEASLPLTLDYKLLSVLLERAAFKDRNSSAFIVGSPGDCAYIRASEPHFSSADGYLQLEIRLTVSLGTEMGGSCLLPVEWDGYLVIVQQPVFDSRNFSLSFRSIDAGLFTLSRQPATIAGLLWEFAQPRVFEYLNRVRIDLAPPIADLRGFLEPLFPEESRQETLAMLDSLKGGSVAVKPDAVVVELLANVREIYDPHEADEDVPVLYPEERAQVIELWETWDAFLVQLLVMMAAHPLGDEDHQILIDVLLDTRHFFADALERSEVNEDFVRKQFVDAWQQLSPVFRRQLFSHPSDNLLGYLGFFTAADALGVLDHMGPTLGIEISRNGLLRLAKMLTGKDSPLLYGTGVDLPLRQLFGLPPEQDSSAPSELPPVDGIPAEPPDGALNEAVEGPLSILQNLFFATPAAAADIPPFAEILSWKVPADNIDDYASRVRKVVDDAVAGHLGKKSLTPALAGMFRMLIPALAWQESCFRQFVVKRSKLTYLLSYNQSSVGLMQVNERVWRGIYDQGLLRWDIRYNARAGCEIAELYLHRYILKKASPAVTANPESLAKLVYALYNGGPGQYQKYLAREKSGNHYKSDQLFAEKLKWVKMKAWDKLELCLVGG